MIICFDGIRWNDQPAMRFMTSDPASSATPLPPTTVVSDSSHRCDRLYKYYGKEVCDSAEKIS